MYMTGHIKPGDKDMLTLALIKQSGASINALSLQSLST